MKSITIALACLLPQVGMAAPIHPAKVIVIGIDGVSRNLLEPFAEQGVTPVMGALMKEGARGHLKSIWPLRTPQVWTSVVTGKMPDQHGIWDHSQHTYFVPPEFRTKTKTPVTSGQRRSKALWQILEQESPLKTLTVGWMATWPSEKTKFGTMIAPTRLSGDSRQTTIKGSFYRGAPHQVSPAKYNKTVNQLIVDPADITADELKPFADLPSGDSPLFKLPYLKRYTYGLNWSLARAKSVERLTTHFVKETKPDVVLSYFQCPDSLLHRFWIFHKGEAKIRERLKTHGLDDSHSKELAERFKNVVEACYRDVDTRVGKILEAARGQNTLVLIVSDHGFGNAPVPHQMKAEPYSGDHLDDGIIIAAGPQITKGSIIKDAGVLDITPTLLHYLGRPVAKDMGGRVLDEIASLKTNKLKQIESYEAKPQTDIPHPDGYPPRKNAYRSAAAQMPKP